MTMNKMRSAMGSISRSMVQTEGRICELEDRAFKIIQEKNKEKRMKKEWGKYPWPAGHHLKK